MINLLLLWFRSYVEGQNAQSEQVMWQEMNAFREKAATAFNTTKVGDINYNLSVSDNSSVM